MISPTYQTQPKPFLNCCSLSCSTFTVVVTVISFSLYWSVFVDYSSLSWSASVGYSLWRWHQDGYYFALLAGLTGASPRFFFGYSWATSPKIIQIQTIVRIRITLKFETRFLRRQQPIQHHLCNHCIKNGLNWSSCCSIGRARSGRKVEKEFNRRKSPVGKVKLLLHSMPWPRFACGATTTTSIKSIFDAMVS